MTADETELPTEAPVSYVVAHQGAELFGSDRMLLESVRGFVESGVHVTVALPEAGPLADELDAAGAEVAILPMLVLRKDLLRPRSWGTLLSLAFRGWRAAWTLLRRHRPNAVYVSTITIPQWPLVARLLRVPVVTHVHEAETTSSQLVNRALYAPQLAADHLIVNSEFSRGVIESTIPRLRGRSTVVYNGVVGPPDATPPRSSVDRLRILYVGRLSPRKGVDDVITAARLLRGDGHDVAVALLGSPFAGYEWYEEELRELSSLADSPAVEFLGFRPDIWPVLAAHDVLVVPSRLAEPFGNTAVEGVLAQRPVIATRTGGLPEAVAEYSTTALVPASDPVALAAALDGVRESWPQLVGQVAQSAERAAVKHSPSLYRRRISEIVRGLWDHEDTHGTGHVDR